MEKIPTLFTRSRNTWNLEPRITPGCEWVVRGEGRPTRKVDGTAVLIQAGRCYKRRIVRTGQERPPGFLHIETNEAGNQIGWMPVNVSDPNDQYFAEGVRNTRNPLTPETDSRTYELVGPHVQGNTERLDRHEIIAHDSKELHLDATTVGIDGQDANAAFRILDAYLGRTPHEGIVWHHPDGRRAKIKRRDFAHQWPIR